MLVGTRDPSPGTSRSSALTFFFFISKVVKYHGLQLQATTEGGRVKNFELCHFLDLTRRRRIAGRFLLVGIFVLIFAGIDPFAHTRSASRAVHRALSAKKIPRSRLARINF